MSNSIGYVLEHDYFEYLHVITGEKHLEQPRMFYFYGTVIGRYQSSEHDNTFSIELKVDNVAEWFNLNIGDYKLDPSAQGSEVLSADITQEQFNLIGLGDKILLLGHLSYFSNEKGKLEFKIKNAIIENVKNKNGIKRTTTGRLEINPTDDSNSELDNASYSNSIGYVLDDAYINYLLRLTGGKVIAPPETFYFYGTITGKYPPNQYNNTFSIGLKIENADEWFQKHVSNYKLASNAKLDHNIKYSDILYAVINEEQFNLVEAGDNILAIGNLNWNYNEKKHMFQFKIENAMIEDAIKRTVNRSIEINPIDNFTEVKNVLFNPFNLNINGLNIDYGNPQYVNGYFFGTIIRKQMTNEINENYLLKLDLENTNRHPKSQDIYWQTNSNYLGSKILYVEVNLNEFNSVEIGDNILVEGYVQSYYSAESGMIIYRLKNAKIKNKFKNEWDEYIRPFNRSCNGNKGYRQYPFNGNNPNISINTPLYVGNYQSYNLYVPELYNRYNNPIGQRQNENLNNNERMNE